MGFYHIRQQRPHTGERTEENPSQWQERMRWALPIQHEAQILGNSTALLLVLMGLHVKLLVVVPAQRRVRVQSEGTKSFPVTQPVPLPHISTFMSVRLFSALRELMPLSLWGINRA